MKNLILIKFGGSVITNKKLNRSPRRDVVSRLAKELASTINKVKKDTVFIIATGGGSYSHPVAAKYQVQKGFINKNSLKGFALTAFQEVEINQLVVQHFLKNNIPAISFGPRSYMVAKSGKINNVFVDSIKESLDKGVVPVVYGDMVVDNVQGCVAVSGETVLTIIAAKLRNKFDKITIINCGRTSGVYDGKGKTVPVINTANFSEYKKYILGSDGVDVTGGMIHKVEQSLTIAREHKICTLIINGNKKNELVNAILGKRSNMTLVS